MRFHMGLVFMEAEHVVDLCKAADQLGYYGVLIPDHIFYPQELKSTYLYSSKGDGKPGWGPDTNWPDPWCVVSACSTVTSRIHFTTGVYVAPARDLFTVAKLVSTAAFLSNDRVHLGIAAGWCEEEFIATGQDFATRGKRLAEMVPALRNLFAGGWAEFHGRYYDFDPVTINPVPRQPVPIYLGGDTDVAMKRAVTIGDGWVGAGPYSVDQARTHLGRIRAHLDEARRSGTAGGAAADPGAEFPIYLGISTRPDIDVFRQFADEGVTDFICAPWLSARVGDPSDLDGLLKARIAQCERFANDILDKVRD